MKKTLIVALMTVAGLSACSDKDTDMKIKNCMEKDNNLFLVEVRKMASDPVNISAQYLLRSTCEELVKNLK
jgi:hypothetical protein